MADLYPESMLEDLVAAYFADAAEASGQLESIIGAPGVYKGFAALDFKTPALIFGCSGSTDSEVTGNFTCTLAISVRSDQQEESIRTNQTAREAELRTICRDPAMEEDLNIKATAMDIPLRVQWWEPKELSRGTADGDFVSAQTIEVEVYFI